MRTHPSALWSGSRTTLRPERVFTPTTSSCGRKHASKGDKRNQPQMQETCRMLILQDTARKKGLWVG